MPTGEAAIFNMDGLMRVMGKDAKGRAAMFKMVRGAIDSGREPLDQAHLGCRKGGCATPPAPPQPARRGRRAGRRRLIQATMAAEDAIHDQREEELDELYRNVRSEPNKPWPRPAPGWNASNPEAPCRHFATLSPLEALSDQS
jgi:hypothetical protein